MKTKAFSSTPPRYYSGGMRKPKMVANQGSSQGRSSMGVKNKTNRKFYRAELKSDDDKFVAVTETNVGSTHYRRHVGQGRSGSASYPKPTGVMEVTRGQVKHMCKVDADAFRRKQRGQQAFSKKKDATIQHQRNAKMVAHPTYLHRRRRHLAGF